MKVKLNDLVEAIEFQSDESQSFIHLKTGEIYLISNEAIHIAEDDGDDYPDWQEGDIKIAKDYLENENDYLALPSQHEANEYQMMEYFAANIDDEKIAGQLLISLQGKGAFRRFKDSVILLGIDKEWYKFRDEKYKQFASEWCEENKIDLIDKKDA